ncbi:MAG: LysR family transcriptional regulator [Luteitalea sp.]|nr:LysR family transcriptional regulator [Luteitalea sp.]
MTRLFLRVYFRADAWIGPGKIQLLEGIRDHGSISAAARAMDMSYRRAWLLVDSVNRMFREPAVRTLLGGRRGGAATLTPFGLEIIRRYHAMEAATRHAIARDAAALERRVRPSPRRSGVARVP